MDLISSSPNHVIREMTPKGNVIRECTEIQPVIRDRHPLPDPFMSRRHKMRVRTPVKFVLVIK